MSLSNLGNISAHAGGSGTLQNLESVLQTGNTTAIAIDYSNEIDIQRQTIQYISSDATSLKFPIIENTTTNPKNKIIAYDELTKKISYQNPEISTTQNIQSVLTAGNTTNLSIDFNEINIKRQGQQYIGSNTNTLLFHKISDSTSLPKTKILGYDPLTKEVVYQNDGEGSGPQDLEQTLTVGNTITQPIIFSNNGNIKSNGVDWIKESVETTVLGTANMTQSKKNIHIKADNMSGLVFTNSLTNNDASIAYNMPSYLNDLSFINLYGGFNHLSYSGSKIINHKINPSGQQHKIELNDGIGNNSHSQLDGGINPIYNVSLKNNANQLLMDQYTMYVTKITDNTAINQNYVVSYDTVTGELGYITKPVSNVTQNLEQTSQYGNNISIPINFNGVGGISLKDATIERIKSVSGDTTLTQNKLYVDGLTNASKPNILYYDTVTKEVTYNTAPVSGSPFTYGSTTITFVGLTSASFVARYRYDTEFCDISIPEFTFQNIATAQASLTATTLLPVAIRPALNQHHIFNSINNSNSNTSLLRVTPAGNFILQQRVLDSPGTNFGPSDIIGVRSAFSFSYRLQA